MLGGIALEGPSRLGKYFSPYANPRLQDGPEGEHLTARLADETVRFIRKTQEAAISRLPLLLLGAYTADGAPRSGCQVSGKS